MKLNEKIRAIIILEIIGRPPEHIKETLSKLIQSISEEKGIKIIENKIGDAQEIKEKKDFYSSFAEIEIQTEDLFNLSLLIFKYMPSHIDIISPEKIEMTNHDWNNIYNEITRRLHGYDEIARVLQMQNLQMQEKLKELGVNVKIQNSPEKKDINSKKEEVKNKKLKKK
jgi:hypothetical protein